MLAVALGGCSGPAPTAPTPGASAAPGASLTPGPSPWKRVWFDGFSGPAGSVADPRHWSAETGGGGWGNSELEYYTPGAANAQLDGHGSLAIVAKSDTARHSCWYGQCRYTSARLTTQQKFAVKYGRIEARIRVPAGSGVWPAFWMLGADIDANPWPGAGEIDVMENVGREPSTVYGSLHGPGYSGANDPSASYTLAGGEPFSAKFHTFAVDWTPQSVEFLVDGHVYETRTAKDVAGHPWVFRKPFFLLLNLAIGGSFPGDPEHASHFSATMLIDYVAVYKAR